MSENVDIVREIKKLLDCRPFKCFTMAMNSGERYDVTDSLQLALGSTAVVLLSPKVGIQVLRKSQIAAVNLSEAVQSTAPRPLRRIQAAGRNMSEQVKFDGEVQKLIHADPFLPFSLILSSGDRFEVTDTGFFIFGESVVMLVQRKSGLAILRKHEIVGVEVHQTA